MLPGGDRDQLVRPGILHQPPGPQPGRLGLVLLQLSDGTDVMLYVMRLKDDSFNAASSGTLVDPQGQARHLTLADFTIKATGTWKSPHSGATYPSGWQVNLPRGGLQPHGAAHPGRPGTAHRHELLHHVLGRGNRRPGEPAGSEPSPDRATSNSPATPAPWAGGFKGKRSGGGG